MVTAGAGQDRLQHRLQVGAIAGRQLRRQRLQGRATLLLPQAVDGGLQGAGAGIGDGGCCGETQVGVGPLQEGLQGQLVTEGSEEALEQRPGENGGHLGLTEPVAIADGAIAAQTDAMATEHGGGSGSGWERLTVRRLDHHLAFQHGQLRLAARTDADQIVGAAHAHAAGAGAAVLRPRHQHLPLVQEEAVGAQLHLREAVDAGRAAGSKGHLGAAVAGADAIRHLGPIADLGLPLLDIELIAIEDVLHRGGWPLGARAARRPPCRGSGQQPGGDSRGDEQRPGPQRPAPWSAQPSAQGASHGGGA